MDSRTESSFNFLLFVILVLFGVYDVPILLVMNIPSDQFCFMFFRCIFCENRFKKLMHLVLRGNPQIKSCVIVSCCVALFLGAATLHKWIKITAILWTFEVQEQLGHLDIKSVACMINEFFTCGDNFTAVASKLWPFKFASPRCGYLGKKRIPFVDGCSFGNQEK